MFRSSHLSFLVFEFLVTFGDKVTKTRNFYIIFVYILQDMMSKTEKPQKENHTTKVTKIPKTKRQKNRMNKTLIVLGDYCDPPQPWTL